MIVFVWAEKGRLRGHCRKKGRCYAVGKKDFTAPLRERGRTEDVGILAILGRDKHPRPK